MLITTLTITLGLLAPQHPSDIVFPEYVFSVPQASSYKEELPGGIPVFIAEDRELPLINIVATFRGGDYFDPPDKIGLCGMMGSLIRSGGTVAISAEDVDEQFAFLAANAAVDGGSTTIVASLNCLSSNFEESFDLWLEMLQHPGFQESRIRLAKDNRIEGMKQRNDYPSSILRREFSSLLYGDSYLGRRATGASIQSISSDDMRSLHIKIVNPANLILSVSGDFDKEKMLEVLADRFSAWAGTEQCVSPPDVISDFSPGIYYVDQEVSQGGVRMGLRSLRQGDPDVEAAYVMNHILGGGGFSSRITQRVRSDEGLAYSAGSRLSDSPWGDGIWRAGFETKSSTVALASVFVFDEINKIRDKLVSAKELLLAKNSIVEQFPSMFQSKSATLGVFVSDELTNRPDSYWSDYRKKIRSVNVFDVQRVAKRLLHPKRMAVVIVGNWNDIEPGDSGGRATMADVLSASTGEIVELPLRDPLTLEESSP